MTKKLLIKDDSDKLSIKVYKEIVNKVIGKKTTRVTISDEEYSTFASSETNSIVTTIPFTIGKSKVKHELSIEYKLDDEASITLFLEENLGVTTANDIINAVSSAIEEVVADKEKEDAKPKYVKLDSLDDAEKALDLNKDDESEDEDQSLNIDFEAIGDLIHKAIDSFAGGIQELASDENKQKIKDKLNEAKDTIKDNVDKAKENIQTKAKEYQTKVNATKKYKLDFDWMTITLINQDDASYRIVSLNKDEAYVTVDASNQEIILGGKIKFKVSVDEDNYLSLDSIISLDDNTEYYDLSATLFDGEQTEHFDVVDFLKALIDVIK